jgi:hypothetical protein
MACITLAHKFEADILTPAHQGGADVTVQCSGSTLRAAPCIWTPETEEALLFSSADSPCMSRSSCAVVTLPLCATSLRGSSLGTSTASADAAAIDDAVLIVHTRSRSPALDPCSTPQQGSAHCKQESTGRTKHYASARSKATWAALREEPDPNVAGNELSNAAGLGPLEAGVASNSKTVTNRSVSLRGEHLAQMPREPGEELARMRQEDSSVSKTSFQRLCITPRGNVRVVAAEKVSVGRVDDMPRRCRIIANSTVFCELSQQRPQQREVREQRTLLREQIEMTTMISGAPLASAFGKETRPEHMEIVTLLSDSPLEWMEELFPTSPTAEPQGVVALASQSGQMACGRKPNAHVPSSQLSSDDEDDWFDLIPAPPIPSATSYGPGLQFPVLPHQLQAPLDASNDITCGKLPPRSPVVVSTLCVPLTPTDVRHRTNVGHSHYVHSHPICPVRPSVLNVRLPSNYRRRLV